MATTVVLMHHEGLCTWLKVYHWCRVRTVTTVVQQQDGVQLLWLPLLYHSRILPWLYADRVAKWVTKADDTQCSLNAICCMS